MASLIKDEILRTCERFGNLSFLGIKIILQKEKKSPLKNVCLSVLDSRLKALLRQIGFHKVLRLNGDSRGSFD